MCEVYCRPDLPELHHMAPQIEMPDGALSQREMEIEIRNMENLARYIIKRYSSRITETLDTCGPVRTLDAASTSQRTQR